MKKADVVAAVAEATGQPKTQVEKTLDSFVEVLFKTLATGEEVSYPNLGKFHVTSRAARQGRNPHTGETINITAKKAVKFGMSKQLKTAAASAASE